MARRLLQAMAGARHGGAELFFVRLAVALEYAGEEQRVLIRHDSERLTQLREAGIAVTELGFRNRLDLATKLAFRREIERWKPSIVLTWMSRATQLCPTGNFRHVARLGGYYDLKYYRNCDDLIGNTRAIAAYAVRHGWPEARVHYLPNFAADLRGAMPIDRAALATPAEAPVAVAIGRLHPNKGFDLLLQALGQTADLHLWIVGEGPLGSTLRQMADALGIVERVRFLGWRDDVPALLGAADFLVSSSRHEPLGNVVLEAWSAERAVIATASDGPSGLIEDGKSGLLVPTDAAALARAMMALSTDQALRSRLASAGRRAYEAEFTEEIVVARFRRLFDELA